MEEEVLQSVGLVSIVILQCVHI